MDREIEQVKQLAGEIDGWLSEAEGKLLYKLAENVPKGQVIVEIGSWKAKSTVWLAKGAKAGNRNKLFAIDPHRGSKSHVSEGEEDTYPIFLVNLSKAGVKKWVVPLVMTSDEAAQNWQASVGLLWIDGSHEYEHVKHDLLVWKQHLSPGSMIALHDCDNYEHPGPARVAQEYLVNSDEFTIIHCGMPNRLDLLHSHDTIVAGIKC